MPLSKSVIEMIFLICSSAFGTGDPSLVTPTERICKAQLIACYSEPRVKGTFPQECVAPILEELAEYEHRKNDK